MPHVSALWSIRARIQEFLHARLALYQLSCSPDPRTLKGVCKVMCKEIWLQTTGSQSVVPGPAARAGNLYIQKFPPNLVKQDFYVWVIASGSLTRPIDISDTCWSLGSHCPGWTTHVGDKLTWFIMKAPTGSYICRESIQQQWSSPGGTVTWLCAWSFLLLGLRPSRHQYLLQLDTANQAQRTAELRVTLEPQLGCLIFLISATWDFQPRGTDTKFM